MLIKRLKIISLVITTILFLASLTPQKPKPSYISVTVNIIKEEPNTRFINPEISFLSDSTGCTIHYEDGWTSETPSEFYFTVNIPEQNETAPTMLVDMKGKSVRRVIMPGIADAKFEENNGKIKIKLVKQAGNIRHLWSDWTDEDRTDVQFPWNWVERRGGKYADPEPLYLNRNLAHIAYAIGAREVYKEWDIKNYLEKNFPGKGDAASIGYENINISVFDPTVAKLVIETCDLRTKRMRTETLVTDRDTAGGKRVIKETICKNKVSRTAVANATIVFSTTPITANCNSYKAAISKYTDALEPFSKCTTLTAEQKAEWNDAIDEARADLANACD